MVKKTKYNWNSSAASELHSLMKQVQRNKISFQIMLADLQQWW